MYLPVWLCRQRMCRSRSWWQTRSSCSPRIPRVHSNQIPRVRTPETHVFYIKTSLTRIIRCEKLWLLIRINEVWTNRALKHDLVFILPCALTFQWVFNKSSMHTTVRHKIATGLHGNKKALPANCLASKSAQNYHVTETLRVKKIKPQHPRWLWCAYLFEFVGNECVEVVLGDKPVLRARREFHVHTRTRTVKYICM